jgi:hypothetical protein
MIVICKKWHVAKRLVDRIRQMTNVPCIEYLFNEEGCGLPDLGGIQSTMGKRHRHRRALMRMLYDYYETDRLVVCMDPANLDLLEDFARDRAQTRMLELDCAYSDTYLVGHALRAGLAGDSTPRETLARLLPTVRNDLLHESDLIRDAKFDNHGYLRETDPQEARILALAGFLSVPAEIAREILAQERLFGD